MLNPPWHGADAWLLVVAAALIDEAGRVLVQRRRAGGAHGGLWEFPGGKVEPGEAPPAALSRELAEELGIAVDPDDLAPVGFATGGAGTRPLLLLLYAARDWRGTPRPLDAAALHWCDRAALDGLAMPEADVPLVAALHRYLAAGSSGRASTSRRARSGIIPSSTDQ